MNITRDNYETYFIDYWDGNLTSQQVDELRVFLLINSDLEEHLQDIDLPRLAIPSIKYNHKKSLKKHFIHECPDFEPIAIAEGALTEDDRFSVKSRMPDPELVAIYKKLKFAPDLTIIYPKKSCLYHKNKMTGFRISISVAAILGLFLAINYLYQTNAAPEQHPHVEMIQLPASPAMAPLKSETWGYELLSKTTVLRNNKSKTVTRSLPPTKDTLAPMQVLVQPAVRLTSSFAEDQPKPIHLLISPFSQPEIYLEPKASYWKPSENKFLSDNIFNSIISTGKLIAGIIKNKEEN